MKLFLGLMLFVSSTAFAGSLQKQVVKMGTCVGVKSLEAAEITFKADQIISVRGVNANMLAMSFAPSEMGAVTADAYTTDDEFAYTMREEEGGPIVAAYSPWRTKGKQVLVWVKGEWLSLKIGFNSKTCWF